jgi:hypothetical protein
LGDTGDRGTKHRGPGYRDEAGRNRSCRGQIRRYAIVIGGQRQIDFDGMVAIAVAIHASAAAMATSAAMASPVRTMAGVMRHKVSGETSANRAHECHPNLQE